MLYCHISPMSSASGPNNQLDRALQNIASLSDVFTIGGLQHHSSAATGPVMEAVA